MPEHQQIKQSKKTNTIFQKQATPVVQTPVSNPYSIIQRAKINPRSLTPADIMQLHRTIGNQAVGRLLSSIGSSSTAQQATVQRQEIPEEEEPLQGKFEDKPEIACPSCFAAPIVQKQESEEEEKPLQGKMIETIQRQEIPEEEPLQGKMAETVQRQEIPEEEPLQTKRKNNTGMPDDLKSGVESLSGIDMSDVRVQYNSSKPAEVGALAYTQGTNIHVAPGQERHLSHEAWHVVQQKQGRVQPTMQLKGSIPVNNDDGLEHEADVMGTRALQMHHPDPVVTSLVAKVTAAKQWQKDTRELPALQNVIQARYMITHPETHREVDLDNQGWDLRSLTSLYNKLSLKERKKHDKKFRELFQHLQGPDYATPVVGASTLSPTAAMTKKDRRILGLARLKERATVASSYTKNPEEIWRLARSEETEPLIEESAALARHKVSEVRKLGVTSAGGMVAGKLVDYGGQIIGQSMGPVAAATSGAINALHTGSQAARLDGLESADPETREAISHFSKERAKKSATQVGKTTASAATGVTVGAAIGTAIPVPVLGTLVGALVGGLAGFTAGKVAEILGDKVLKDPKADYEAAQKLHYAVLDGDEQALQAFKLLGIDEETAKSSDGWKALVEKIGASPGTR